MANIIKQYRREHRLSRAEFAQQAQCSVSFVGHLERGIRTLSPEKAMEWEKRLGIPREKLRDDIWKQETERT